MVLPRFTLRQLDIFAAVMSTGRVRGAAEQLHLSQAAVSQALAELADALGTTLFERRGRRLAPTAAAHRLATLAESPRQALNELVERLHGQAPTPLAGPVIIAASSTIARYFLPAPLATLANDHPALRITLSSTNSATVETRVADGAADLGFIEGPATRDDLIVRHWRTDRLEIIGPPDGPDTLDASTLHEQRWVMREAGSGTRSVFEQRLALAGLTAPTPTMIVDDAGAQVRAVAAGAGLACVSREATSAATLAGRVRRLQLSDQIFERPLWSVRRATSDNRVLAARLSTLLEAAAGGPHPPA